MTAFEKIGNNKIRFIVDTSIYNDHVISKVLYWLVESFYIERESISNNKEQITLERKTGVISDTELHILKEKLNRDFIDFKTRDIVNRETQDIRDILYIKAFANDDDFEDYNLTGE